MSASEKAGNTAEGWNRGAAQAGYGRVRAGGWSLVAFCSRELLLARAAFEDRDDGVEREADGAEARQHACGDEILGLGECRLVEECCEEQKRKVRIAAGGLQSIWRLRELLNPFRYGVLTFQYVSHRVLRWSLAPVLLFALLPLNIAILLAGGSPVCYGTILALQLLFYIMGGWGYYLSTRQVKNKLLFIPYYFLFMNINVMKGVNYLRKKKGTGAWEKAKRTKTESLNQ